jgi:hypothetical protein
MRSVIFSTLFFLSSIFWINAQEVSLFFSVPCGFESDTITMQFKCTGFQELIGMQMTFQWDTAEVEFLETGDYGLPALSGSNFGLTNIDQGYFIFLWDDPTLMGQSLPDSSTLFTASFIITASPNSLALVEVTDEPAEILIVNADFEALDHSTLPGLIKVLEPLSFELFSVDNPLCDDVSDGSIDIGFSGGEPPYTYLWSNGFDQEDPQGLTAGIYTVTISDACTNTFVSNPILLEETTDLAGSISTKTCGDLQNMAMVDVIGGISPYAYHWSTGDSSSNILDSLVAGNYSVTVEDVTGCMVFFSFEIPDIPSISLNISSQSNVSCFGEDDGAVSVQGQNGTPPYQFFWNTGDTVNILQGLSPNLYSVTMTDFSGCLTTLSIEIMEPNPIDFILVINEGAGTASVNDLSGGTPPYEISWSDGQTGITATNLEVGSYGVTITDDNGCQDSTFIFINSIKDLQPENPVQIYPNPTNEFLIIQFIDPYTSSKFIDVINEVGRSVKQVGDVFGKEKISIDTRSLVPGNYWIKIGPRLFPFHKIR